MHRDINEFEYISALLQSNQHVLRTSGKIIACDLAIYLKSRHGLIVPEEVINRLILTDLAGQIQDESIEENITVKRNGKDEKPHKSGAKQKWKDKNKKPDTFKPGVHLAMDISQIAAVLLIPELIEASSSRDMKIFAPFRDVITAFLKDDRITAPILREIFASVNECIVSDDVINEMLQVADCPEFLFKALVSDVMLYSDHENVSNAPKLAKAISDPIVNDGIYHIHLHGPLH